MGSVRPFLFFLMMMMMRKDRPSAATSHPRTQNTGAPSKLTQSPVKHFNYVPAKCSFGDLQNWYIIRHPARGLVVIRGLPDRLEARIRCWSGGDRPPNRQKRRRRGSLRPLMRWRRGDFGRRSSAVPAFPAATATRFLVCDGFGDLVGRQIKPRTGVKGAAKRQASVAFATLAAHFRGRVRR